MKINVSEIFFTIQGEGPHVGRPSIFIRLSGCNLRCKWGMNTCDTPYTSWNVEANFQEVETVVSKIQDLRSETKCNYIVLTGGEPTIQTEFPQLCRRLKQLGFELAIETNGTGEVPKEIDYIICSPKLSDSVPVGTKFEKMHDTQRKELNGGMKRNPKVYLKFVYGEETNIAEILEVVEQLETPKENVYLMPEGVEKKEIEAKSEKIVKICKCYNFNFSTRLHILLWGLKRGV